MGLREKLLNRIDEADKDGALKELYIEGVRSLSREHRSYGLNSAFVEGYQWTHWLPSISNINEVEPDSDRCNGLVTSLVSNRAKFPPPERQDP